ncbi:uncharacterized protein LOC119666042 [Teleopsis dalmanni]|uniref:uncharacterized protein LOC119666042 n=1 Tax=Teleopsis dalmanni TaxID=139649 RepID=UPI0018CFD559|nr:uncharacterized protein LOC119666042 [Teleopsis dalmanni]
MMIVKLKFEETLAYIIPTYINCNNWDADFKNLSDVLFEFGCENILVVGDCNARIGKEQCLEFNPTLLASGLSAQRKAMDNKVDRNGRRLLEICNTVSLTVLNGRCEGDKDGKHKFHRGTIATTIDYGLGAGIWLNRIKNFEVQDFIYSDHQPITVSVHAGKNISEENSGLQLLPKLYWNKRIEKIYNLTLNQQIIEVNRATICSTNGIEFLMDCINNAAKPLQQKQKTGVKQNQWFDSECKILGDTSFRWLRRVKKTGLKEDMTNYSQANKRFKELLQHKRATYYNELAISIATVKDSKSFWGKVRKLNGTSHIKNAKLDALELSKHFERILNNSIHNESLSYEMPIREMSELDTTITVAEVKKILHKCKDNKAPGEDRVPMEFLKYASDLFIENMTASFNYIYNSGNVPDSFRKSIIFPLYKKSDTKNPENYRGISFNNAIAKVFASILNERLQEWLITMHC